MLIDTLRRLLGLEDLEQGLDEVRVEQLRVARELEQLKRARFVGLDVEVEQLRGIHPEQNG